MSAAEYALNEHGFREMEVHDLENLIERRGLQMLLQQLSEICGQKSEYYATQVQDTTTAKSWATACGALGVASVTVQGL